MQANKAAVYCLAIVVLLLWTTGVGAYLCINRMTNQLNRELITETGKCTVIPIEKKAPKKKHNHIHKNKGDK